MAVSGVAVGYRNPRSTWVAGFVIAACQVPVVALYFVVSGELAEPTRSTGGAPALFIGCLFILLVSPVPVVAARYGRQLAQRRGRQRDEAGV